VKDLFHRRRLLLLLLERKMRFISWEEAAKQLEAPCFTLPVTNTFVPYLHYRGVDNALVHTLRFNKIDTFSERFMFNYLLNDLSERYQMGTVLTVSLDYDALLTDPKSDPQTYYIWLANSNRRTFNRKDEILMALTYANLYRYCQAAMDDSSVHEQIDFIRSGCSVMRTLALVFTFVPASK
jgi:hypothetical protein